MKYVHFAICVLLLACVFTDDCLARENYKPGETAQAFHDEMVSMPLWYRTETKPDFTQFLSEVVYQKNTNWRWGPGCQISAKALKQCLYEVSAEIDKSFPDILSYGALEWAFVCLTAVVKEEYQPSSFDEVRKKFRELWEEINSQWLASRPDRPMVFLTTAFGVEIQASSDGNKHRLGMQLPETPRVHRLKKLERYLQELNEIRERFPVLKKNVPPLELLQKGLVDLDSLERYAILSLKISLLSEEIKREREQKGGKKQ